MNTKAHRIVITALSSVLVFSGVKYKELQTNFEEEQQVVRELRTRGIKREEKIEELKSEIDAKTKRIAELKQLDNTRTTRINELEEEIGKLQAEVKRLRKKPKSTRGGGIAQRSAVGSVPDHSPFKSYMDYRTITSTGSPQYKLQQQANSVNGFRMLGGRYMIALGSAFGKVGDHVTIVLESGVSIPCIIGDIKADHHTDSSNKVHLSDGSIIEFIVDTGSLSSKIKSTGDCSYAEHINLQGRVKSILR
jgi:hypothetical protein